MTVPDALILPDTVSRTDGDVVPIPRLPLANIVICVVLNVRHVNNLRFTTSDNVPLRGSVVEDERNVAKSIKPKLLLSLASLDELTCP